MKKLAFICILFFAFSAITGTVSAETNDSFKTAMKYYHNGNYKKAAELLKEYVKKNPEASAYYRIGYSLYELGRYDEANEYFQEAYLIDPVYSPDLSGALKKYPEKPEREAIPPETRLPSELKQEFAEKEEEVAVTREVPIASVQPSEGIQPQKPLEPVVVSEKEQPPQAGVAEEEQETATIPPVLPQPEPETVKPEEVVPPVAELPPLPIPEEEIPAGAIAVLIGMFAGFLLIPIIIGLALLIFMCVCLYLISKKLDAPYRWTAWIPFLWMFTIVGSAGKPLWFVLLLFIPFIQLVVGIYLWMCITENLGRNKWLALLLIIPIVNIVFLAILAFSKSESYGYAIEAGVPQE